MERLAMLGGPRSVTPDRSRTAWPVVTDEDRQAVLGVLERGRYTSTDGAEGPVALFERDWARFVGVPHCVAVANGTAAISLAVTALGIDPGAEILVPALSFIASAVAPLMSLVIPVFVDVDPRTFNMDPALLEAAVTPRTQAVLAVHLHGLPADMDPIRAVADRHGLAVIEDAAQAHGARYRDRRVGAIGDAATFSLNVTKNLPTCGEGGMVTTADPSVHERVLLLRQFGEVLREGEERTYLHHVLAGNEKMNAIQAAFATAQLGRFQAYAAAREANVCRFLGRLSELPGVLVPWVPPDRTHAWHILRLRFDPVAAGLEGVAPGPFRKVLQWALRAEGAPLSPYQIVPLPGQGVFRTRAGLGAGYPWTLPGVPEREYRIEDCPVTAAVIEDSLTVQRWHLNPASGPVLDAVAGAFEKIWDHLEFVARIARSTPYEPPWAHALAPVGGQ